MMLCIPLSLSFSFLLNASLSLPPSPLAVTSSLRGVTVVCEFYLFIYFGIALQYVSKEVVKVIKVASLVFTHHYYFKMLIPMQNSM